MNRYGKSEYSLPDLALITDPEKIAGMIRIWKVFDSLISLE